MLHGKHFLLCFPCSVGMQIPIFSTPLQWERSLFHFPENFQWNLMILLATGFGCFQLAPRVCPRTRRKPWASIWAPRRPHVTPCAAVRDLKLLHHLGVGAGSCAVEALATATLGQRRSRARGVAKTNNQLAAQHGNHFFYCFPCSVGSKISFFATPLTKYHQYWRRPHTRGAV